MVAHLALHVLSLGLNTHELTCQVVPRKSPACYSPLDIIHCCLFQWAVMKKSEVNHERPQGLAEGSGMQIMFSSILPPAGNNEGRNRKSTQMPTASPGSEPAVTSRIFDHRSVYMTLSFLATDR